ncbi:hypothetical protein [Dechloromonas sp.]|uniref:hypothetical protein n=1 Tax=Dechloromonas sp. TaxID=1917218 RepID=UPI00216FB131|nr:hypothetical protein [Dechloromonas sp.]MBU3695210.1 hypothetical protein [Dechloromonas sp.]
MFKAFVIAAPLFLAVGQTANAGEFQPMQFAELIVGPEKAPAQTGTGARNQRDRAAGYRDEAPIFVDDGPGILSPRGGAPAEERAYDNRSRARSYQQQSDPAYGAIIQGGQDAYGGSDNRARARAFATTGNNDELDLSNVGRDGIPLVPCRPVDNVSGRIGDDSIRGAIVLIVRNGQKIKVRCN